MKLYTSHRAPNPRRVRWVMAEKGIDDIELVEIDLLKGEQKRPEYRDRVGRPVVPALELDDGTVLVESVAIARYLEALHPEPNMFGRDAKEIAVIEMWTRFAEMAVANPLALAARYGHPALAVLDGPDPAASEQQRQTADRALKRLDRQLADHEFLAADRLTIADIVAVSGMDFARLIRWRPPEGLTHVARWYESVRTRPAAAAGM
jgi:glutathione S-transferase